MVTLLRRNAVTMPSTSSTSLPTGDDPAFPRLRDRGCDHRPDLLCMEGIARTLMVYKGTIPYPNYNVVVPAEPITMTVHPEVPSRLLQHHQ